MVDIEKWMDLYRQAVLKTFGERVQFIGLQGSYARGEAKETSDIDVVFILDKLTFEDLKQYKDCISALAQRELLCGFVAGREELENWDKADLFQFFFDTKAVYGRLEDIIASPSLEDAKRAAALGACSLYHACSHNFLHTESPELLAALYKSARFVLQAEHFCESGNYAAGYTELLPCLSGSGRDILETSIKPERISKNTVEKYSRLLLEWARERICRYAG